MNNFKTSFSERIVPAQCQPGWIYELEAVEGSVPFRLVPISNQVGVSPQTMNKF